MLTIGGKEGSEIGAVVGRTGVVDIAEGFYGFVPFGSCDIEVEDYLFSGIEVAVAVGIAFCGATKGGSGGFCNLVSGFILTYTYFF